jgi:hypothetical protein
LALGTVNLGTELWGVESFFLSMFQNSTPNYGRLVIKLWNIERYLRSDTPKFNELQFVVFSTGFSNKKYPKMISVKKITLSIWTSRFVHVQWNWVVKLDLVILTSRMINKMINYSTNYLTGG